LRWDSFPVEEDSIREENNRLTAREKMIKKIKKDFVSLKPSKDVSLLA